MFVALLTLFACSSEEEAEDPEAHACEHAAEAGTAITAGADTASAPTIALGEEPYTVTLVDAAAGYVAVEVTEDTPALLFLGTADVVSGLWFGDAEESLPTPSPSEACPEDIPEHYDLDLHEAGTWYVQLGPAAVSDLWLLLAPADGHAHE